MASPPDDRADLERISQQPQPSIVAEFFDFLKHNKKWWLLPILLMVGLFGLLMIIASTSSVAPFIYTLF
jgi:hypothetical protein